MKTFPLVVASPDGRYFDEPVSMLSLRGIEGDLAILAGHEPFITALQAGKCKIICADESVKTATLGGGLLIVSAQNTTLLSSDFAWADDKM